MHKWERVRSNSYGSEYRCMKCCEYITDFNDNGDFISVPPASKCPEDGKDTVKVGRRK